MKRTSVTRLVTIAMVVALLLVGVLANTAGADTRALPNIPLRVMIPHPTVAGQMAAQGQSLMDRIPALTAASFQPGPRMTLPIHDNAGPADPFRALAILVDFSDNVNQVTPTYFDTLLYDTTPGASTVANFYLENSYGELDIIALDLPSDLGWNRANNPYGWYVQGNNCFGSYPQNCQGLAEEMVYAADAAGVDFSQYDNDGDGTVDTVFIIHAGPGAEYTGSDDDIWSHSWVIPTAPQIDGVTIWNYTAEPEFWAAPGDMTMGVYGHELGHAMGLPDLYDVSGGGEGIGRWGMMSGGSWNGDLGDSPSHFSAWSKEFLEFLTPINITGQQNTFNLPDVETSDTVYRIDHVGSQEYYLIENRQFIGYDVGLGEEGLAPGIIIYHVDGSVGGSNSSECLQHNNWLCGAHYRVAVEQADGNLDLEYGVNRGDATDPFFGSAPIGALDVDTFNFYSTPNNSSYYSSDTIGWSIENISPSSTNMSFDLAVPSMGAGWYEEDYAQLNYNDNWAFKSKAAASAGTAVKAKSGAEMSFTFEGDLLTIYRRVGPNDGMMEVCVDGVCQLINNYAGALEWTVPVTVGPFAPVVTAPGADAAAASSHNVTISRPADQNAFWLDAFEVIDLPAAVSALTSGVMYNESSANFMYQGTYITKSKPAAIGGQVYKFTDWYTGVYFHFTGGEFTFYTRFSANEGDVMLCIDGWCMPVSLTTSAWGVDGKQWGYDAWVRIASLSDGPHYVGIYRLPGNKFFFDGAYAGAGAPAMAQGAGVTIDWATGVTTFQAPSLD